MTKEIIQIPVCPFCGKEIERPEIKGDDPDIVLGKCECGSVYACDESGKNLGTAFIEALVLACNKNWNMAWDLSEDEDFKTEIIEHYDRESHLVVPGGVFDKRRVIGALYFVKLNKLLGPKDKRYTDFSDKTLYDTQPSYSNIRTLSKKKVEELISSYNLRPIIDMAGKDRKLIQNLQRLLYSADPLIRLRAAEALGKVCGIISKDNPQKVARLIQTLLYSIIDTAAFSIGAFEAVAEIIVNAPDLYEKYIPYIWQLLSEESRRPKAIMALARISEVRPEILRRMSFYLLKFLNDKDPEVRGYTVLLLKRLNATELKDDIEKLKGDMNEISLYENGEIKKVTINQLVLDTITSFQK